MFTIDTNVIQDIQIYKNSDWLTTAAHRVVCGTVQKGWLRTGDWKGPVEDLELCVATEVAHVRRPKGLQQKTSKGGSSAGGAELNELQNAGRKSWARDQYTECDTGTKHGWVPGGLDCRAEGVNLDRRW